MHSFGMVDVGALRRQVRPAARLPLVESQVQASREPVGPASSLPC